MNELLAAAIAQLEADDNPDGARRLLALANDPDALAVLFGELDTATFAEWTAGTSATGEAGWISTGGQFRKDKPHSADEPTADADKARHAADVFTAGVDALLPPEVKGNPGILKRVKEAALDAAAHVYGKLVLATPALHQALNLFMDVTDDPRSGQDFSKLGYQPTLGTAGHETGDPVRAQLGISAGLASTIATKVLGTAIYHFRKKVLGHFKAADAGDWIKDAATELAELINSTLAKFGLPPQADPAKIEAAFRAKQEGKPAQEMEDKRTPTGAVRGTIRTNPQTIKPQGAKPATGEVALAGADGRELARLMGQSKAYGVKIMSELVLGAVKRYKGFGNLLNPVECRKLTDALAAVNSTADLLGRSRVREMAERATVFKGAQVADIPFQTFADNSPGIMATPEDAVAFFSSLTPSLGIDPKRYGDNQRRSAFTLAASTNLQLTQKVQRIIADSFRGNESVGDAQTKIRQALEGAGISPKNPSYSEMVFRTNVMDSFQTGMYEEGKAHDLGDTFPVWQYLIVDDSRTGDDHRPKGNKYYPKAAAFSDVRGPRVYNCRCSMRWIDKYDWQDLEARGHNAEDHY